MFEKDMPRTKEQAKTTRYGAWGGRPRGTAWVPERCAYSVSPNERGSIPHQCSRKPGHGPDSLYCGQHSKHIK